LAIRRRLAQTKPQAYELDAAQRLIGFATLYSNTQRFSESEATYKEALAIYRRLAQSNPQAYEPRVATALNNLALLYSNTQRFTESEAMYKEALEIYRRLAQTNPQAYEPNVATTQYNLGLLKVQQELYPDAITSFEEALEIYRRLAKINPAQQQWYKASLFYLSKLYPVVKNYSAAYRINQEWLPILKQIYEENSEALKGDYAAAIGNQSWYAIFMKQYAKSEQLAREGLAIDSTKTFIYSNLAAALLFQGKYAEAEKLYRQYKSELKVSFLDDFRQYAEVGVIPKECEVDVEKIKKMLNE
jgi:tetratricopeptide (TPR) repeat protein